MTEPYYPEYQPADPDKFRAMLKLLGTAQSATQLEQLTLLYTFDMTYPREDLMVAVTRIERAHGWRVI